MRDYKFRGKRKGSPHEWIYGDLNHIDGKVFIFDRSENAPLNSPDWFEVDPESVGQLTGIKDKNGKEIYEFDVVRIIEAKRNYTVEFIDYKFQLVHLDPKLDRMHWGCLDRLADHGFTVELIGTIHETPELWQQRFRNH